MRFQSFSDQFTSWLFTCEVCGIKQVNSSSLSLSFLLGPLAGESGRPLAQEGSLDWITKASSVSTRSASAWAHLAPGGCW